MNRLAAFFGVITLLALVHDYSERFSTAQTSGKTNSFDDNFTVLSVQKGMEVEEFEARFSVFQNENNEDAVNEQTSAESEDSAIRVTLGHSILALKAIVLGKQEYVLVQEVSGQQAGSLKKVENGKSINGYEVTIQTQTKIELRSGDDIKILMMYEPTSELEK
ncbi:hypothetical protein PALB_11790 [Pseudoalteromonas luteoviolacea B = ATCC 29581]|nr:hypothetical protein PALB_11790 [Pseudoalteromonas luteoviolacea B = ATCC 29581]